jgi:enoyl-CoA hydratase
MSRNDDSPVLMTRCGRTLVITMNRPAVKNAANVAMAAGMEAAMRELADDDELWVGIVTGAGGSFSSGGDVNEALAGRVVSTERGGLFGFFSIRPDKTIIAAIEGLALGGGLELALRCDLIVAARGARLGLPEVRNGMMALGGGLALLPRRIPYFVAMDMCLSGEPRLAEELAGLGLISRLCEPGQALQTALRLAERICANGPVAVAASRRIVTASAAAGDEAEAYRRQDMEMTLERLSETADFQEGLRSFTAKRTPIWQNR